MTTEPNLTMILLAGEQAAPNLLPVRHYNPNRIFILHSRYPKSKRMAEQLQMCFKERQPCLVQIEDYEPGKITAEILPILRDNPGAMVNITGGTKPMSLGALEAAFQSKSQALYVRSQGAKTQIDLYGFTDDGGAYTRETTLLEQTITLDNYLMAYFGTDFHFIGFATGDPHGCAFEKAVHATLKPHIDEIRTGWKHNSEVVEVDFVVRCSNQIGIIEAKTGTKARTAAGIQQLATAGGQRFFGTFVRRFLVIDQAWTTRSNLRRLAETIGISIIELPSFAAAQIISPEEQEKLIQMVRSSLGAA